MPDSLGLLDLLHEDLSVDTWGDDGLLHASELADPLRHVQLRMAGAPAKPKTFAEMVVLETGKMWHKRLAEAWDRKGVPFLREVEMHDGLPEGWGGHADFLVWDHARRGFVLYDLKTTKSSGLQYIHRDGAKKEHIWQVSTYWWALKRMGYPVLNRIGIIYLPKDEDYGIEGGVQPVLAVVKPLDEEKVLGRMTEMKSAVDDYLESLSLVPPSGLAEMTTSDILYYTTDELAPPMPREQRLYKNKELWEVKLIPHWTSMFCPYPDELCDCGHNLAEYKTNKIGHFAKEGNTWLYKPSKGYEDINPKVKPLVAA